MSGKARILSPVIDGEPQWHALVRWLDEAGAEGVHTHDMHRAFIANAGQRKPEVEKNTGRTVISVRESRNGKPGARYFWAEFAPPDSPAQVCGASPADTGRLPAENLGGLSHMVGDASERDGGALVPNPISGSDSGEASAPLIPNVATAGLAAAMAEFDDDEPGVDWWEEAA